MYKTYILYSESKDRFYIGHTADIDDRINRHNNSRSKSTKYGIPWKIVYTNEFTTKSEAYQYEMYIKKQKSREFIMKLVNVQKDIEHPDFNRDGPRFES